MAILVVAAMAFTASQSLEHTDVERPMLEVSSFARNAGAEVARSEALYVSPAEQKTAIARLVKRNEPLFCAGTRRYASLTFDDGPSKTTPKLVKMLKDAGIQATWFVIGKNVAAEPDDAKLLPPQGPIGNHTWSHANLTTLSRADLKRELNDTQRVIRQTTGQNNKFMRPPYGARNPQTLKQIDKLGYAEILWSADSEDGLAKPWQEVARNAVNGLGPGAVILLHDGPAATLTALRKRIIPAIKRSGLTMVSVPDLLVLNRPSNAQLDEGPRGCSHAGKVNVSGSFGANPEAGSSR